MTSHKMFRIPEGGQIHIQREPGGPFIPLEDVGIFSPEMGIPNAPDAPHGKTSTVGDFTTSATFTIDEMDPKVLEMIWGRHDHGLPYHDPWGTEKATRKRLQHLFHNPKSAPTQENTVNLTPDDLDTVAAILNEPTVDDLARARRERREPATRTQDARETQKQRDEWREQVTAWFGMDGTIADEVRHNTYNVGQAAELRRQKWADAFKVTEEQITRAIPEPEPEPEDEVNDEEQYGQDDEQDEQDDPTAVPPFHATVADIITATNDLDDNHVIDQEWIDNFARTQAAKHQDTINVYGTPNGADHHRGHNLNPRYEKATGELHIQDEHGATRGRYAAGEWVAAALCADPTDDTRNITITITLPYGTCETVGRGHYLMLSSTGTVQAMDNFATPYGPSFTRHEWTDITVR